MEKKIKVIFIIFIVIIIYLIIQLFGIIFSQFSSVKELEIGETLDYSFGGFYITGFKRANDTLYFSYKVIPNGDAKTDTLTGVTLFIDDTEIPFDDVNLRFDNYYPSDQSSRIKEIDADSITAIGLNYDGTYGKWIIDPTVKRGGDINRLETLIATNFDMIREDIEEKQRQEDLLKQKEAQRKEIEEKKKQEEQQKALEEQQKALQKQQEEEARKQQEELQRQQEEAARAQREQQNAQLQEKMQAEQAQKEAEKAYEDMKSDAQFYGGEAVKDYGKTVYPYGFKLHNWIGVLNVEQNSDGSWFLKITCDVTNEYGATARDLTCEATIRAIGDSKDYRGWSVESFNVY